MQADATLCFLSMVGLPKNAARADGLDPDLRWVGRRPNSSGVQGVITSACLPEMMCTNMVDCWCLWRRFFSDQGCMVEMRVVAVADNLAIHRGVSIWTLFLTRSCRVVVAHEKLHPHYQNLTATVCSRSATSCLNTADNDRGCEDQSGLQLEKNRQIVSMLSPRHTRNRKVRKMTPVVLACIGVRAKQPWSRQKKIEWRVGLMALSMLASLCLLFSFASLVVYLCRDDDDQKDDPDYQEPDGQSQRDDDDDDDDEFKVVLALHACVWVTRPWRRTMTNGSDVKQQAFWRCGLLLWWTVVTRQQFHAVTSSISAAVLHEKFQSVSVS